MPAPARHLALTTLAAAAVAVTVMLLIAPEAADAALRSAAGGGRGGGGFASLSRYLDKLAGYLIALAVPLAALGLIGGGALFMAGSPRGTQILGYVALGFVIVIASKGLAA